MSYADLARFKEYLRLDPTGDTDDDTELQSKLDTATSSITHLCSRTFELAGADPDPVGQWYSTPVWDRDECAYTVDVPDLFSTDGLAVYSYDAAADDWITPVTLSAFAQRPRNAPTKGNPWTSLLLPVTFWDSAWHAIAASTSEHAVRIDGYFGWPELPTAVVDACLIQAARWYKRREATFGIVGAPDGSDATRLLERIDSDVVVMLRPYIKYWAAG